jgi:hypothetical protein
VDATAWDALFVVALTARIETPDTRPVSPVGYAAVRRTLGDLDPSPSEDRTQAELF